MNSFFSDLKEFAGELIKFTLKLLHIQFIRFEKGKGFFVGKLYRQRGKLSKRLIHFGMSGLAATGIIIGPYIANEFPGRSVNPWNMASAPEVLSACTTISRFGSADREPRRPGELYTVQPAD